MKDALLTTNSGQIARYLYLTEISENGKGWNTVVEWLAHYVVEWVFDGGRYSSCESQEVLQIVNTLLYAGFWSNGMEGTDQFYSIHFIKIITDL